MARRLPPLNALRAFEAVARQQSISAAADELCVTHSAVSRHVAKLEEYLGAKLFTREHQRLTLNARGVAYAAQLTHLFDAIGPVRHEPAVRNEIAERIDSRQAMPRGPISETVSRLPGAKPSS
jgi:LysR family glycine cleavage system transcriptional activator